VKRTLTDPEMPFAISFFKKKAGSASNALFVIAFVVFLNCIPFRLAAQFPFLRPRRPDSAANNHLRDTLVKKRFGRSAFLWALGEAAPWTFDRYVAKSDFVNISFKSFRSNLNPGTWFWDNDDFLTNQFVHPAGGSIFFNAYRSNGYSFWQSAPAVVAGSYLWETVAEKQAPSVNDFVNTTFGGIVLGEMTHRFANKIISHRGRRFNRQASEALAFIINPANGLNRIMDGKWGKMSADAATRDSSTINADFDLGGRSFKVNNKDQNFGWYSHLRLIYGTPYEDYKTPFSNIYVNAEVGKDDSTVVNTVTVYGSLNGWRIRSGGSSRHLVLMTANYDYIFNEAFSYSAESIKFNLFSEFTLTNKLKINTIIGAGPNILAAVPDPYMYNGRPYDFCTGAGYNATLQVGFAGHFFYGINYRGAWLKTISGNASHYFLNTVTSEIRYKVTDGFSVCAEPGYFSLMGDYEHVVDLNKTYPYLRISARYSLNFQ